MVGANGDISAFPL